MIRTITLKLFTLTLLAGLSIAPAQAEKFAYFHLDALGSPVAATDELGNLLWREDYTPYGDRLLNDPAAANDTRWYTGHVHDQDTGLTYMGARYYDPALGRFMGVDPAAFTEGNPHSFNRFAYANNNPYAYVDPDGEFAIFIPWIIGGALFLHDVFAPVEPIPGHPDALLPVDILPGPVKGLGAGIKTTARVVGSRSSAAVAKGAKPTISPQKQAGHIPGTPQNTNRIKQGKPTSSFFGEKSGERLTQRAFEKGKTVPGRPNVKEHDFGISTGTGPNGGMQTRVRVHQDSNGRIHGHPFGQERF